MRGKDRPHHPERAGHRISASCASANSEDLTAGPDGNLWFTTVAFTDRNKIGRITPSGQITEFPIPLPFSIV